LLLNVLQSYEEKAGKPTFSGEKSYQK